MDENKQNPKNLLSELIAGIINGAFQHPEICYIIKNNADDKAILASNGRMYALSAFTSKEQAQKFLDAILADMIVDCSIHTYDWESLLNEFQGQIEYAVVDLVQLIPLLKDPQGVK